MNNISFLKIDIKEEGEKQAVMTKYITPFLTHCEEIIVGKELLFQKIQAIVPEFKKDKVQTEYLDNEGETRVQVSIENEASPVTFDIKIEVDENNMLKFQTPYFFSEFDVKVITETALKTELTHIMSQIVDHYYQLKRLSTVSSEENGKLIDCLQIVSAFDNVNKYMGFEFVKNAKEETSGEFTFSKGGESSDKTMSYRCFAEGDDKDSVLFLEVNFSEKIPPLYQIFMEQSYYDLIPVAERIWQDSFDLALKLFAKESINGFNLFKDES